MNSNFIWFLTTSAVLFWCCLNGVQTHIVTNNKRRYSDVLDNASSETGQLGMMPQVLDSQKKLPKRLFPQHSKLLFKLTIASNNVDLRKTSSRTILSQIDSPFKGNSHSLTRSPGLSSDVMSSKTDFKTEEVSSSVGEGNAIFLHKISSDPRAKNSGHSKRTKMEDTTLNNNLQSNRHSFITRYYNGNMTKLLHPYRSWVQEPFHSSRLLLRFVKREISRSAYTTEIAETSSIFTENTIDESAPQNSSDFSTNEVVHPVTLEPMDEEFLPGMTKYRFTIVASTVLMIALCSAAVLMYSIRRRRLRRLTDPEYQRLIPFKMQTGMYYNQTGLCF